MTAPVPKARGYESKTLGQAILSIVTQFRGGAHFHNWARSLGIAPTPWKHQCVNRPFNPVNEPFGSSDHRLVVLGRARWTIVATPLAHARSDQPSNPPMTLILPGATQRSGGPALAEVSPYDRSLPRQASARPTCIQFVRAFVISAATTAFDLRGLRTPRSTPPQCWSRRRC